MGRHTSSDTFVSVYLINAGVATEQAPTHKMGRGAVLLTAGQTYRIFFDGQDCRSLAAQLQWDATLVITSATMYETLLSPKENAGAAAVDLGGWVPCKSTNLIIDSAASGVVTAQVLAVAGGTAGGAIFDKTGGGRRHMIEIVVGGTGGEIRSNYWGKE